MLVFDIAFVGIVHSPAFPTIFVDPPNVSGLEAPPAGSVLSLKINVSDIVDPGFWGYEFCLSLNSTVFPSLVPLCNMNFTTDAIHWTTSTSGSVVGTPSIAWDSADGNPEPGSDRGSLRLRANSSATQPASITFITEQTFSWPLCSPPERGVILSFAYRIAGNSIPLNGITVGVRVIKPSGGISSLIPSRTYSAALSWLYDKGIFCSTQGFSESGAIKFQLRTVLKTATAGVDNFVQVNWDDVGLLLAPVSVSEGQFLKLDSRNAGKTYFSARYFQEGYVYIANSLVGQPYIDAFPVIGSGNLAVVNIVVGYGSTALDLYKTVLLTLGSPPSYIATPIYPYFAEDGWFDNGESGKCSSPSSNTSEMNYGELEPGVFYEPKLIIKPNDGLSNTTESSSGPSDFGEPVLPLGLTENYQKVRLLIAGDEEMIGRTWTFYDQQLPWISYLTQQITFASYYFNVGFDFALDAVAFTTWQSDDSQVVGQPMLDDAIAKIGWTVNWDFGNESMVFDGKIVDMLVVATGQIDNWIWAGIADTRRRAAVLIQPQDWWADDNLIQHEISHLYGAPDHKKESDEGYNEDCIMTYRFVYVGSHYDNGYTVLINSEVPVEYVTHNYHSTCYTTIFNNRFKYGIWVSKEPPPNFNPDLTGAGGGERPKVK